MKCHVCKRKGNVYSEYLKDYLCKKCFEKMIVKRIQKTISKYQLISARDSLLLLSKPEIGYKILNFHFKESKKRFPLKVKKFSGDLSLAILFARKNNFKIVDPSFADFFASEFLKIFFSGRKFNDLKPKHKNIVRPLFYVTYDELLTFAKIKNIKVKKEKFKGLIEFIHKIKNRRPGVIHAILHLNEILQKR